MLKRFITNTDVLTGKVFISTRNMAVNYGNIIIFTGTFGDIQPFLCPFKECHTAVFIDNDMHFLNNNITKYVFPNPDIRLIIATKFSKEKYDSIFAKNIMPRFQENNWHLYVDTNIKFINKQDLKNIIVG